MIDMDRQKAFAVLGLPDDASREEIDALVSERRRKLRQRIVFAATAEQRESSERALAELETAHAVATLASDDPDGSPPAAVNLKISEGTVLGDRFVIRRRIGFGENGAVFAALDLSWGKEIALKVIRPELLLVPGTFERLEDSVRKVFDLAHSGVVSVYGVFRIDGHIFIAMELLPERNLRVVLNETPPTTGHRRRGLPVPTVVDLVQDICSALDYARSRTLHLNLKPDNVIITDEGFVKLTDFGLEPILSPAVQISSPTAREQRRYRAPELARQTETGIAGSIGIDERADQYSVAAIVHFLLLATAPYPDPSATALRHMGLSKSVSAVLSRALSSEPRERFTTVADFATALKHAARNQVSRRVLATTATATLAAFLLVLSISIITDRAGMTTTLWAPLLRVIPGLEPSGLPSGDVLGLHERVLELSASLTEQQNALRRQAIEGRIDLRAKAQALELADTDESHSEALQALHTAQEEYLRVTALREIANPEIFNSPDTLNAVNLIGLAGDHLQMVDMTQRGWL